MKFQNNRKVLLLLNFPEKGHGSEVGLCLTVIVNSETGLLVTGKFVDFPVCVIRYIFIRKLLHLTISSPFILINQKNA